MQKWDANQTEEKGIAPLRCSQLRHSPEPLTWELCAAAADPAHPE